MLQEWWGLNDQIREVCDRFAAEGFVALAPDIYRGVVTREPDEAAKLMMALNIEQAAKDMVGAVDFLAAHEAVTSSGVGVTGYCMGGGLALWLATLRPGTVTAVVPHYGVIPWPAAQPDYSVMTAQVQGHYAENDDFAGPPAVAALEEQLTAAGKDYEFFVYPGASTRSPTTTVPRSSTRSTPRPPGREPSTSSAPTSPDAVRGSNTQPASLGRNMSGVATQVRCRAQARPIAASIDGGRSSSPRASMSARSTLMASRDRSAQVSHGPGGMPCTSPRASTHARR